MCFHVLVCPREPKVNLSKSLLLYSQSENSRKWSDVEFVSLPQEDEGPQNIAHGKESDTISASQEHDSQSDPVRCEENHHLHHVQVVPEGDDWPGRDLRETCIYATFFIYLKCMLYTFMKARNYIKTQLRND